MLWEDGQGSCSVLLSQGHQPASASGPAVDARVLGEELQPSGAGSHLSGHCSHHLREAEAVGGRSRDEGSLAMAEGGAQPRAQTGSRKLAATLQSTVWIC